jgi:hypothetical protein
MEGYHEHQVVKLLILTIYALTTTNIIFQQKSFFLLDNEATGNVALIRSQKVIIGAKRCIERLFQLLLLSKNNIMMNDLYLG